MLSLERPLEDVALRRRAHLVGAEVVGAAPARVVLRPVLHHVVRHRPRGGPVVTVDRGLRVRVDVVEQREPARQRVGVRRDSSAEERQVRVAVPTRIVPKDLIVGADLLDDVEDVLDRSARTDGCVGRRVLLVDRVDLAIGTRCQVSDLKIARELEDPRAPAHDRGQVLEAVYEVVAVVGGVRIRAVRIRSHAQPASGYPGKLAVHGAGCDDGRIGAHRKPAHELEGRHRARGGRVTRIAVHALARARTPRRRPRRSRRRADRSRPS